MPRAIMHTSFKVKRSRSRPINAETEKCNYLWNGKACIRTTTVKVHLKEFLEKTDTIRKMLVENKEYLLPYFLPGKREKMLL